VTTAKQARSEDATDDLHGRDKSKGLRAAGQIVHATPGAAVEYILARIQALTGQPPRRAARPSLYAATAGGLTGGEYIGPGGWTHLRGAPKEVPIQNGTRPRSPPAAVGPLGPTHRSGLCGTHLDPARSQGSRKAAPLPADLVPGGGGPIILVR
jgi:hypothetical protein